MSTILLRNGLVINGVAFICYALVGLVLLRCWQKNPSAVVKHRIFKSLAAIMTLVVGSYLAVCVFRLLLAHVTNPLFVLHISPSVTALFTVISASSNAPLLFAFSSEYRLAFHKHLRGWPLLGKWLIRMEQQTQIAVTVNFNAVNSSNISPCATVAEIGDVVDDESRRDF
uniref:G_PROTEIN_RECEP_F1_2 domain-containing protein n=1 Tax=Globodera pallida TaxID=36090 RepID=A0A183CGB9_GLOPA